MVQRKPRIALLVIPEVAASTLYGMFDVLDILTANIMLPLGGLFIAVFAGWVMRESSSNSELNTTSKGYNIWLILVRYVTPVAVMMVFLNVIGFIQFD